MMVKKITREQVMRLIKMIDGLDMNGKVTPPVVILREGNKKWFDKLPIRIRDRLMTFELVRRLN